MASRVDDPPDPSPASLSASHGKGEQPLHTDGASQLKPSRWLLLASSEMSSVPTLFWPYRAAEVNAEVRDALNEGLFTAVSGRRSFLTPAHSRGMLRFDRGCMSPSDGRALVADEFLSSRRSGANEHAWDAPDKFLVLDNHRVLHGRADATGEPDRLLRRITFDLVTAVKR